MHAKIAPDAFRIDHFEVAHAVLRRGDRLVRRVLARDMAQPALDAAVRSMRALMSYFRFRYFQSVTFGTARPRMSSSVA